MLPRPVPSSERGIALVLVLTFLVILSALIVAFFSSVTTVTASARTYADGVGTNLLADTAVQIVMSQIREATTPASSSSQPAWMSQPGMIRVFGTPAGGRNLTASSTPYAYYKLYSSDDMVVSSGNIPAFKAEAEYAGFLDPTQRPLYTDLNNPILASDPNGTIKIGGNTFRADYPIFDPGAINSVEGFSITDPPGYAQTEPPADSYNIGASPNPAPMPVKWLYMLRDGSVTAPTSAANGVATWSSGAHIVPTKDNPIVGRIAFWTDDETCKVNINTASEGTYWDTPMVASIPESGFGISQPTRNEFQRYPGHPATVSLSPILGTTFGIPIPTSPVAVQTVSTSFKQTMYGMIPRVQEGGSLEGTVSVSTSTKPVTLDYDRLYASVDELFFQAARTQNNPKLTNKVLRKVRPFLTASSRAPELNLFGKPRIGIWPVSSSSSQRSVNDKVFAFCSTIGDATLPVGAGQYPFYFTRQNPKSATDDFNLISRNQTLYQYLQTLTGRPIPGFGGNSFLQKYPAPVPGASPDGNVASDRDQILTEIFDYIRCTNLADNSAGATPYTPLDSNHYPDVDWSGQVVPIQIANTRGFGRFPTISEAALLFMPMASVAGDAKNTARMQAILVLESFCPSYGYSGMKDTYSVKVDFAGQGGVPFSIIDPTTGQQRKLGLPDVACNIIDVDPFHGPYGRIMGGYEGFGHTLWYNTAPGNPVNSGGTKQLLNTANKTAPYSTKFYPFVSDPIIYPTGGALNTFTFLGGTFDVYVYPGLDPSSVNWVQKLTFTFPPNQTVPTVKIPFPTTVGTNDFTSRIGNHGTWDWILTTDAARSVEAVTDHRLVAARKVVANVPAFQFFNACSPSRWMKSPPQPAIHSLRNSNGARYSTAVPAGILAHDISTYRFDSGNPHGPAYYDPRTADVPETMNGVHRADGQFGDWDNGFAKFTDGEFINRADEGNVATAVNVSYYQGSDYQAVGSTYFSPNRIIASPGWFGSLPTGVQRNLPYQTLLFRPDGAGRTNHPGIGTKSNPADHLILDLFDMPVVEPYPMSEPFSTAGKINLNYQIMPFGKFMKRDTAMRALLRSERLLLIPFNAKNGAHSEVYTEDSAEYRHEIDESTTLAFLERRWNPTLTPAPEDQVFRSASQICELDLYPRTATGAVNARIPVFTPTAAGTSQASIDNTWRSFWEEYRLTGDNTRERPYARLYSRLTTKSNTFTVHLRVQSLAKRLSDPNQASWDETKDQVTGEYRGSALIERYIDPTDRRFNPQDVTTKLQGDVINPDADELEQAYKFRVVATKQFGQ